MPRTLKPSVELFPVAKDLRKGQRTRIHILKAAFECMARDGYYRTTFQTIADYTNLSQPLIVKVFGSRENIFPVVAEALLTRATQLTEGHLESLKSKSSASKMEAYFEISLKMLQAHPLLAKFYINIYYLATYEPRIRKFNQIMRTQALERLTKLLGDQHRAEMVHNQLTGFILNAISLGTPLDIKQALNVAKPMIKDLAQ